MFFNRLYIRFYIIVYLVILLDLKSEPCKSTLYYSIIVVAVSVVVFVIDLYVFSVPFALGYLSWSSTGLITSLYIIILLAMTYVVKGATKASTVSSEKNINTLIFIFIYSILLSFVLNLFGITSAIVMITNTVLMMYFFYKRYA